jgi:hypothetical protein
MTRIALGDCWLCPEPRPAKYRIVRKGSDGRNEVVVTCVQHITETLKEQNND